jgi:hypothetical protein
MHVIKAYGEVKVQLHSFLTSALYGGELPASTLTTLPWGTELPVPTAYDAVSPPQLICVPQSREHCVAATRKLTMMPQASNPCSHYTLARWKDNINIEKLRVKVFIGFNLPGICLLCIWWWTLHFHRSSFFFFYCLDTYYCLNVQYKRHRNQMHRHHCTHC